MTVRTSSRGAPSWRQASLWAICIAMLVATLAAAANIPGIADTAIADHIGTPGIVASPRPMASPGAMASPEASASPAAMATPMAMEPADWSNGADHIWKYVSGTDYWAGDFPSTSSGVFGVYDSDGDVLDVFDAVTFDRLWGMRFEGGSYSWRFSEEALIVLHESSLTARNPRTGRMLWVFHVRDREWDWTTADRFSSAASLRNVYITGNRHFTVLDIATGDTLLQANRAGDINWETNDGIMTLRNGNILSIVDLDAGEVLWSYTGAGSDIRYDAVDDDWYVTSGGTLAVIDPSTGEERWSFAGPGSDVSWDTDDGDLYVKSGGTLARIDPTTGEERWRFAGSGDSVSWTAEEDALYVRSGKDVSKLDPAAGTEFWRFSASDDVSSLRTLDGMLLVRSGASVSSIDPEMGVELWRFSLPDTEDVRWDVLDDDETLYVYGGSVLSMLDAETGGERWRFTPGETIQRVWLDNGIFTILSESNLFSIDATTGDERWRYDANAPIESIDLLWSADMERFTLIAGDRLIAIDTATGDELWRSESLDGSWDFYFDSDTETYKVSVDGAKALIDAETGETLLRGSWEDQDGVIYNRTGNLVTAFDLDARGELWRYSSDSTVDRFYLRDDVVLVVTRNLLVALERENGTELWTFMADAPIESFDMDEGTIRLTDSYGTLYALAPKPLRLEAGGSAVTTEKVTLRGAPNTSAVERGILPAGVAVTVTGEPEEHDGVTWWPITTGQVGEQGWVPADGIAPTGNAPSTASTPSA